MFQDVVDGLFVPAGSTSVQYSQGFPLKNDNNLRIDALLISASKTTTSVWINLQVSDDLQNWSAPTGTSTTVYMSGAAPRKATLTSTNVVSAYARFKFYCKTGGGDGLFKLSVSTKRT